MRRRIQTRSETPYVLMVFVIFALFALSLVLFGARVYKAVVADMEENHQLRAGLTYVANKLHSADAEGAVRLERVGEVDTLQIRQTDGEFVTITYIYQYEGSLMELNGDEGFAFDPKAGTQIVALERFTVSREEGRITLTATAGEQGREARLVVTLRTGGAL